MMSMKKMMNKRVLLQRRDIDLSGSSRGYNALLLRLDPDRMRQDRRRTYVHVDISWIHVTGSFIQVLHDEMKVCLQCCMNVCECALTARPVCW